MMKKYVVISGFHLVENNRGSAALGYGSVQFMEERDFLHEGQIIIDYRLFKNPFKKQNRETKVETCEIAGKKWVHITYNVFYGEMLMLKYFHLALPFTQLAKTIKDVDLVAAINGGDGFSDLYNNKLFKSRLVSIDIAMFFKKSLIILPQTLGPFVHRRNYLKARKILKYAKSVFVRDKQFISELEAMGVKYEVTKDLSYYMKPQIFDIHIERNAIGINISGLAYSNKFNALSDQFANYPILMKKLISRFQKMGKTIYLIPHSYNYDFPEVNNDDLQASKDIYNKLENKDKVFLINDDLISPKIKYIISQMSFFIGARMHANFAAIFTNVPLFGLAYSYKFEGAFQENNIEDSVYMINNMKEEEVSPLIERIVEKYNNTIKKDL